MGGQPPPVLVVGCQPASLGEETDGRMGLSEPVSAAVDEAVTLVETLVERLLAAGSPGERYSEGSTL